ncbi:MAG: 50S ribosomal protein L37ae [Candidatus Methanosuratincola sp.]
MAKTKSVKSAGRFGPRYGATLRKRLLAIEQKSERGLRCPKCKSTDKLVRAAAGIWDCRACGVRFAGGAFVPQTTLGKTLTPDELKLK